MLDLCLFSLEGNQSEVLLSRQVSQELDYLGDGILNVWGGKLLQFLSPRLFRSLLCERLGLLLVQVVKSQVYYPGEGTFDLAELLPSHGVVSRQVSQHETDSNKNSRVVLVLLETF